jgi:hypothetical protein
MHQIRKLTHSMLKIENILIAFYGILTIVFFLALIILGIDGSENALLFREVSYFISPYVPQNVSTVFIFQCYNLLLLIFSSLLSFRLNNYYAKLGSLCLSFSGIIGLVLIHFPMDPLRRSDTYAGLSHIFLVMMMSVYIIIAMILFGYSFKHREHLRWLTNISYAMSIFLCIASALTGVIAFYDSQLVGLWEKFPIVAFLMWIALLVIGVVEADKRIKYVVKPNDD